MILQVQIQVKPECVEAFKDASKANAAGSMKEPGVIRYDVYQQEDDPTRFILLEIYRSPAGHAAHRETAHYITWRDTVGPMMAVARVGTKFVGVFPDGLES